jgi:undecaprenyl-diphosphatase
MNLVHVLILALLQGVTELFPVSSLGHSVLLPGLLGWNETLSSPTFLPLLVTLHLGTATALLTFFWRDWVELLRGGARVLIAGRFTRDVDPQGYGRQLALVVIGTIPAGLIGVFLQTPLEKLFGDPVPAAAFLTVNGLVLLLTEQLLSRQRKARGSVAAHGGVTMGATAAARGAGGTAALEGPQFTPELASYTSATNTSPASASTGLGTQPGFVGKSLDDMSFVQAMLIGFAQSFALLPGISRSGSTMAAGLGNGLSHESAARFCFLLATPIILAAGLLEVPKLFDAGGTALEYAILGGVVAGIAAYLSVRFLMKYFVTNTLKPFAWYCLGAGVLAFAYFVLKAQHVLP